MRYTHPKLVPTILCNQEWKVSMESTNQIQVSVQSEILMEVTNQIQMSMQNEVTTPPTNQVSLQYHMILGRRSFFRSDGHTGKPNRSSGCNQRSANFSVSLIASCFNGVWLRPALCFSHAGVCLPSWKLVTMGRMHSSG